MNNKPAPFSKPIYITRPIAPTPNTFLKEYDKIYNSKIFSNFGSKHNQLENKLKNYLNVKNIALFNNGTTALMAAIKALNLTGSIITTPFTFPATINAVVLSGLMPVFCDIGLDCNIDVNKLENAIKPNTSAILAVHTFGIPCNYKEIKRIANKYNLKIIYDAAHAFGVKVDNKSIATLGDITMFSFHATKIFNTIEGGCLCCYDNEIFNNILLYRNFGYNNETVELPGLNGKLNEIQSAIGLLNLPCVKDEIKTRKQLTKLYNKELSNLDCIEIVNPPNNTKHNYQYLIIKTSNRLIRNYIYEKMQEYNIYTRKYFYPCAAEYKYINTHNNLEIAQRMSRTTLALPLYGELRHKDVKQICKILKYVIANYNY